jgi:ubiquinone/menaquinone biosynthesis C-methylase UbiE
MSAKEYFDNASDTWDERFLTPKLSSFLEKFVPQFGITSGQHILDVGTGTGVLIPYLSKAVGPEGLVTAVDYSEKMVQVCKTKHSRLKNVTVQLKNIEEDSFPPESFDAVVCFGVFPHLDNKQQALQNMNCALKPCGKLVIAHALSSEEIKAHHKNASSTVKHDTLPTKDEMTKLLEQTSFTGISIKDEPGSYLCIAHKA